MVTSPIPGERYLWFIEMWKMPQGVCTVIQGVKVSSQAGGLRAKGVGKGRRKMRGKSTFLLRIFALGTGGFPRDVHLHLMAELYHTAAPGSKRF